MAIATGDGDVMAFVTVKPTKPDIAIARAVARNTDRRTESVARGLTWGADEKILLVLAAAGWLATRTKGERLRRAGNHALLVTVATSLLPHAMKGVFGQIRPDRRTVLGHLHGVSLSGKRADAFPSGHAMHMGALASAADTMPAGPRGAAYAVAVGLSLTRILVLAHWASDVLAGFLAGVLLERTLRCWTGWSSASALKK